VAFPVQIATFTFVGEVLFIFWLLTAGRKLGAPQNVRTTTNGGAAGSKKFSV
jgi:hypothetical protein